jgi:outer membrane protein OmpA-like peptidoglycan-associated protein
VLTRIAAPGCVLLLACLAVYTVPRYTANVSADLREQVAGRLKAADITGVIATLDGRDLVLSGNVASGSERSSVATTVLSVPGVRAVRNDVMVVEQVTDPDPPAVSLETIQARVTTLLQESGIEFEKGKARLEPSSQPLLDEIAHLLKQAPLSSIRVEGHTDNTGQAEYNQNVSLTRAQAVVDYLAGQGVAADRLEAVGVGQERPVASNDTREGRMKNRRVEIIVE